MDAALAELEQFAHTLADAARGVIAPLFRTSLERERKEAASPVVTIADREAERVMRAIIEARFPQHGIVGEEFGRKMSEGQYIWVLDPVDGTIAFSTGKPLFGTLIGLLKNDRPMLGIIDQPVSRERWVGAAGAPARCNGQRARTSLVENLRDAAVATTSPFMFETQEQQQALDQVRAAAHLMSFGGDCYNYALLASGHLDAVVERELQLHDWAALVPVVQSAGGVMTDWQGKALAGEGAREVIAAATPALHAQLVDLFGGAH